MKFSRSQNINTSVFLINLMEEVILVDKDDNQIGTEEKIKAHIDAKLHRAFSILIFNNNKELLLQQRALSKYHCPGLWTNTCCSHPRPGEETEDAAYRRLVEEMGFKTGLQEIFSFIYEAKFDNNLTEHEVDHVFKGIYNTDPVINKEEVNDFKWIKLDDLIKDIEKQPENYTTWFRIIIKKYQNKLKLS